MMAAARAAAVKANEFTGINEFAQTVYDEAAALNEEISRLRRTIHSSLRDETRGQSPVAEPRAEQMRISYNERGRTPTETEIVNFATNRRIRGTHITGSDLEKEVEFACESRYIPGKGPLIGPTREHHCKVIGLESNNNRLRRLEVYGEDVCYTDYGRWHGRVRTTVCLRVVGERCLVFKVRYRVIPPIVTADGLNVIHSFGSTYGHFWHDGDDEC